LTKFSALGLDPILIKTTEKLGFDKPTQIQEEAIPLVLDGHDVMGLAQTGTGKTAAFGLPLVDHLLKLRKKPAPKNVHALVLVPTRELANQIDENLRRYVYGTSLKVNVVVGGANIQTQQRKLERGTDVLIATPGRLLDLVKRRAVKLDAAQFLVLDEADQMLDMGFIHALRQIAPLLAKPRQTLLFSATMPKQMEELSRSYLNDPVRVETAPVGRAADKVAQQVYQVEQRSKFDLLVRCLSERPGDYSIVFARTKHGAEKVMKRLCDLGFAAVSVHGNKSQGQRERAIRDFKNYKANILVATDVAARGIDIPGVSHVYNFDLPEVAENYVHRIGRTARAGKEGLAIAFCGNHEKRLLQGVERLMKLKIKVANQNDLAPVAKSKRTGAADPRLDQRSDFRSDNRNDNRGDKKPRFDKARSDKPRSDRRDKGFKDRDDNRQAPKRSSKWADNRADHRADHLMVEDTPVEEQRNNERKKPAGKRPEKKRWSASKKLEKRKIEATRTKSKKHIDRRHERDSENWDDARSVESNSGGRHGRGHRTNDGMGPRSRDGAPSRNSKPRNDNRKRDDSRRGGDGFAGQKNHQGGKPRRAASANGNGYKGKTSNGGGYQSRDNQRGNSGDRPSPQKRRRVVSKQAR
jgi:ATP-dependent RNA helicase RhlE